MISVSPKRFGHSGMVMRDVMLAISGLSEVLISRYLLNDLKYTEEVWIKLWIILKNKIIDKGIS